LTVAGDGSLRRFVEEAAMRCHWLDFAGPLRGREKAALLRGAQLTLMPGLVGLVVIDSFAAETPIITVDSRAHSPEVEYLENGINGLTLAEDTDPVRYANEVARLLVDRQTLERLRRGCSESNMRYTVDEMSSRFHVGIIRALQECKSNP
jgi:glycosyltransferase involved in cell wall biosynthesis